MYITLKIHTSEIHIRNDNFFTDTRQHIGILEELTIVIAIRYDRQEFQSI